MAICHIPIKIIQRSKGKSALAAAAYRSGTKLTNEWDGLTHDYTHKGGVVHAEIMLPSHAPPEFADRSILWNSVEQIEKSRDSQLAREVEVALPRELTREQQLALLRAYVKDNFVAAGMCADFALHDKCDGNPHAHILLTIRPLKEDGTWGAKCRKVYDLDEHGQRKLTNYIRFWQADGESEKTSIRTKTALGQLVEDGGFKGGLAPYGYDLVKSGRFNKRKHEVFELAVNEAEAAVVRIIFDKYVHEGFGAQRIATYLNNLGYRARTGKMWHHASIRGIICNLTYTGVLRSGESRSQTLPHLQIIAPELFEAAQHIRTSRANSAEQERRVPLNTRGQSLLAGNVFCGHCGSRLALTTNGKAYPCKEDAHRIVKRVRYICYGKTRKQTECDGQTGYTAHILDGIIDKVVRQIFERMKAIPKSEIVNIRYREKMEERKALLKSAKSDYAKAAAELDTLRAEVIKSLRGESAFSQDLLSSLIADNEKKCLTIQHTMEAAQAAYDEGQAMLDALNAQYDDIISWADMYDSASMESKKMIVSCLIRRVEVYRDYRLHIDFNIDFEQFSAGLDISAIAA